MVIMKKRSSYDMEIGASMEMGSNIDLSLLRRPLTPFTGFQEAKSAFDKGTAEVRHLLLHECSLIYECNICRNMFRSLANFISHKRVFCCKSALESNNSHDATNGTESRKLNATRKCVPPKNSTESKPKCVQARNIEADVEIAVRNLAQNGESKQEEQFELKNDEIAAGAALKSEHATDLIDCSNQQNAEQTNKPSSPEFVFQCPSCSMTFLKSSSVIRHLALSHNIPIRRIRMMRDKITKRPATKNLANGESQTSNEAPVQTQAAFAIEEQNLANKPADNDDLTKCIFCQKSFDRHATLSEHLQICQIKLEMLEETTTTTSKAAIAAEKTKQSSSNAKCLNKTTKAIKEEPKYKLAAAIAADVDCKVSDAEHEDDEDDDDDVKLTFAQLEQKDFGIGLQTITLDKLELSASESTTSLAFDKESNETTIAATAASSHSPSPSTASAKKRKIRTNCPLKQTCRCKICGKQFNALSNLRRHISMFHYRSRKYGCALCEYCAFRRYDIINHLSFVHKMNGGSGGGAGAGGSGSAGDEETAAASTELAKFVRVNDVPYTKDDMEEDILLINNNDEQAELDGNNEHNSSCGINNTSNNKDDKQPQKVNNGKVNELLVQPPPAKKRRRRNKSPLQKNLTAIKSTKIDATVDACELAEKSLELKATKTADVKVTRQMLRRSLSQQAENGGNATEMLPNSTKAQQKRSKRNRFKTESKDFVYDLLEASLIKNETNQTSSSAATTTTPATTTETTTTTYQLRGAAKRRNTLNAANQQMSVPTIKQPIVPNFDYLKPKHFASIKGKARRQCLLLVSMSLAASSTPPEIPSERPQMRSRLFSSLQQRSDSSTKAAPIIDSSEIDAERLKSLPLCDDSYLEKIAKASVGNFQMKPCIAQQHQHSALDTLLQKFDSTKSFSNSFLNRVKVVEEEESAQICTELNEFGFLNSMNVASTPTTALSSTTTSSSTAIEPFYITPEQAIPKAFVTPSRPQKRLHSLDRLTEAINSSSSSTSPSPATASAPNELAFVGYYSAPIFEQ